MFMRIEDLLEYVTKGFKQEWYTEFDTFLNSIGPFIESYLSQYASERNSFLWFLAALTNNEDRAVDLVME